MCQRDGVKPCPARSHLLALGSETRIPTGYPWLLWVEQGAICADRHGSASAYYQTRGDETENRVKKRRPIRNRSGAWYWQDVRCQSLVLIAIATKRATERTILQVFRRKVEDTTGFRRLGTVEAAIERAGEGGVRDSQTESRSRRSSPWMPSNVLPVISPVRVASFSRVAVISPIPKFASNVAAPYTSKMSPLPSSSAACTLATQLPLYVALAAVRHVVDTAADRRQTLAREVLDEANAEIEIRDILRTVLSSASPRAAQTPK